MKIPSGLSRPAARAVLQFRKNSPTIMFVGGLAGVVTSTVMACKATLQLSEELPKMKHDLEAIREFTTDPEEQRRSLAMAYGVNAGKVVKMYGPSVVVGTLSIGMLTGSHVTLNRRNAGVTAAYAAMSKAYDDYRARVQEELGQDKEKELYRGNNVTVVKTEDGKKIEVDLGLPNGRSPYAAIFDVHSRCWEKTGEHNRLFVKCQQNFMNQKLQWAGHVFLNEVYDSLGLPRTSAGAVVGWIYDSERGDSYIDFGLESESGQRFMMGWDQSVWLDFNVDGIIYNLI